MPNEIGSTGPTWTQIKQAFVSKFTSNFIWFGIYEKLKMNDMAQVAVSRSQKSCKWFKSYAMLWSVASD